MRVGVLAGFDGSQLLHAFSTTLALALALPITTVLETEPRIVSIDIKLNVDPRLLIVPFGVVERDSVVPSITAFVHLGFLRKGDNQQSETFNLGSMSLQPFNSLIRDVAGD